MLCYIWVQCELMKTTHHAISCCDWWIINLKPYRKHIRKCYSLLGKANFIAVWRQSQLHTNRGIVVIITVNCPYFHLKKVGFLPTLNKLKYSHQILFQSIAKVPNNTNSKICTCLSGHWNEVYHVVCAKLIIVDDVHAIAPHTKWKRVLYLKISTLTVCQAH